MKLLGVIPARGGSKGVPKKNIRWVGGKPLIAWTIETALASSAFDRVIVSTDDVEISEIARKYGADVPFMRPEELATDAARSVDVMLHAVETLGRPDAVMMLQPTSPLRTADDIRAAIALHGKSGADAVVSVCEATHPPQWLRRVDKGGLMHLLESGAEIFRRQDAETLYQLNGAIYLIHRSVLEAEKTLFPERTHAYIMPAERSLDVDAEWDFHLAELILNDRMRNEVH